jgi:hypothetical protein
MKNSDNDFRPARATGARRASVKKSRLKSPRQAEILDTLVFLIAGFLLPVWLLGQLFLTFYPAPNSTDIADSGDSLNNLTNVSNNVELTASPAVSSNLESDENSDSADVSGSEQPNPWQLKFETISSKLDALTAESDGLLTNNESLKSVNVSLEAENKKLYAEMKSLQSANDFTPAMETQTKDQIDPKVVTQLQSQLTEMSAKLESERADLMNATTNLDAAQDQQRALQSKLLSLQSDLKVAESKLVDANKNIAKFEDDAASEPLQLVPPANDDQTEKLAEAKQKITMLEQNVDALAQKNQTATTTLANREQALLVSQQTVENLTAQNQKLQTALSQASQQQATKVSPAPSTAEVYREFISSKGNPAKMAFVRWEGEKILFRNFANKKLYRLPLSRFSEADQRYLLDQK